MLPAQSYKAKVMRMVVLQVILVHPDIDWDMLNFTASPCKKLRAQRDFVKG